MLAIPGFAFMISAKFAPAIIAGNYIGHIISFQLDYSLYIVFFLFKLYISAL